MPNAVVVEIAEAVKDALNNATLSQSFTAERLYFPLYEQEETVLKVTVAPHDLSLTANTRGDDDFEYVIDVAVQKRVDRSVAQIDPYMLLVEEIIDYFRSFDLPGQPEVSFASAANVPVYVPQHLDDKRVFTSVASLTFRKARAKNE